MFPAFAPPAQLAARHPLRSTPGNRSSARPRFSMASISRPSQKSCVLDASVLEKERSIAAPEVTAIAAAVCDFMNNEHLCDIANYIVRFGNKFDDLSQLSDVRLTALDAAGFTADVVSCDDSSHCVCVQERLDWPLGLCHNAADIITAFKHLSMLCGLPADF